MMNDMASLPEGGGNEMGEAETVTCLHIYLKPDGSAMVEKTEAPMPEGGTPAASLDEALDMARQMANEGDEASEAAAQESAMTGYNRRKGNTPGAPTPAGIFGE